MILGDVQSSNIKMEEDTPLIGQTVSMLLNIILIGFSKDKLIVYFIKIFRWIDILILFYDKRHALISFEKGIFGQHIIDHTLEAWQ